MPRQEAGKMSEVLVPRGIPRYYWVACALPFPKDGALCCSAALFGNPAASHP